MTGPDPTPTPTGPRTVRDLIATARRAGADHTVYGLDQYREHLWRTPDWQVIYEPHTDHGYGYLVIADRRRSERPRHSRVLVTSVEQAWAVLVALGVLPADEPALAGAG